MSDLILNIPADLPASNSGQSLQPVPKGNYSVTVFDIKSETVNSGANAGKPRWNVQLRVSEGQYENRRFFAYIPLYVAGDFWKTQSFFESLGYEVKGAFKLPEVNEVLGKALTARITVREADGQYEASNNVAGFNAPTSGGSAADNLAAIGATPAGSVW